jgi:hypothetical protein
MIRFTFTRTGPPRATRILIVRVPAGDAPVDVRKAWVGVELPLHAPGLCKAKVAGLLEPPWGRLATWLRRLPGFGRVKVGYAVAAGPAVEELARRNPDAARWFRENVPHLLGPGRLFVFSPEECRTVETE